MTRGNLHDGDLPGGGTPGGDFFPSRMHPPHVLPARRLLVLGGSKRKATSDLTLPAWELYDGPLFRVCKLLLRQGRWPNDVLVLILSAEHGLIPPRQPTVPYDRVMTADRARALKPAIATSFRLLAAEHRIEEAYAALGDRYSAVLREAIPGPIRLENGADTIGRMQSRLRAWLTRGLPAAQLALALPSPADGGSIRCNSR